MQFERTAQDTAIFINFFDGQLDTILEVARIVRAPAGDRQHGADRYWVAIGLGAVVKRDQCIGAGYAHGADRHRARSRHEAAPRRVESIKPACGFHFLVKFLLLGLFVTIVPLHLKPPICWLSSFHPVWRQGDSVPRHCPRNEPQHSPQCVQASTLIVSILYHSKPNIQDDPKVYFGQPR